MEVLKSIRPKADAVSGACTEEAYTIRMILEECHNLEKGSWVELFKGTDLRRTTIACVVFAFALFTGQALMNGYGPRFYTAVGLQKVRDSTMFNLTLQYAFDYQLIGVIFGVVASLIPMVIMDHAGRRPIVSLCWRSKLTYAAHLGRGGTSNLPDDSCWSWYITGAFTSLDPEHFALLSSVYYTIHCVLPGVMGCNTLSACRRNWKRVSEECCPEAEFGRLRERPWH